MSEPEKDQHEVFRRDPGQLMKYVSRRVVVETTDGACHSGWVYTVDPVSSTFVLLHYKSIDEVEETLDRATHAELIFGHVICSIHVLDEDDSTHRADMDALFKPVNQIEIIGVEEMTARCEYLRLWLAKNRVPVERADGRPNVLTVGGDVLTIEPPYNADCCMSTNEIILARVQALIKSMPCDTSSQ